MDKWSGSSPQDIGHCMPKPSMSKRGTFDSLREGPSKSTFIYPERFPTSGRVLRCDFKLSRVGKLEKLGILKGRDLQRDRAATLKALSFKVLSLVEGWRGASDDCWSEFVLGVELDVALVEVGVVVE